jgi:hypothetical protein
LPTTGQREGARIYTQSKRGDDEAELAQIDLPTKPGQILSYGAQKTNIQILMKKNDEDTEKVRKTMNY